MHRGQQKLSDISRFIKAIYLNMLFIPYSSVLFEVRSTHFTLYGIRSVRLKQTDSPDHEMRNAFARLILGC